MPAFESDEDTIQRQPLSHAESIISTAATLQPKCAACEAEEKEKPEETMEGDFLIQRPPEFSSADDSKDADESPVQFSLQIGRPGDVYEREADAMADRAVNTPETEIQPKVEDSVAQISLFKPSLQTKPVIQKSSSENAASGDQIADQLNASKGQGSLLDESTQEHMGSTFGADFSNVRVHTDSKAAQLSQNLGAKAFTHGSDIYFSSGKYDPNSREGKHLLAHELK
ncbi:MAG: DUF4157 domain-containing protein [Leptolyngbya sp. SIO4C1]|nr:DUF4157 domain-containing protein [Leptolyngbya sp. SIO4C1]